MISHSYPQINVYDLIGKCDTYPQVYPQLNVTDIFKMWFEWSKVEQSGDWNIFMKGS
jgi:hypothetical protein